MCLWLILYYWLSSSSDSLVKSQCSLMIILLRLATELSYLGMSESQVPEEMILLLYFSVRRTDRWTSLYQGLSCVFPRPHAVTPQGTHTECSAIPQGQPPEPGLQCWDDSKHSRTPLCEFIQRQKHIWKLNWAGS